MIFADISAGTILGIVSATITFRMYFPIHMPPVASSVYDQYRGHNDQRLYPPPPARLQAPQLDILNTEPEPQPVSVEHFSV